MSIITYPNVPLLQKELIGNKNNYYPNKAQNYVIGRNNNVNNTRVDLWEGPTGEYIFPTTAIQMQIVSTSANDTAAGTGARQIHIHYLDNTYTPQTETINLNGTTPVTTVATNILRINGFHVWSVGSGGTSAGNISLTNTGVTVTYGYILAGSNTAHQAIFTIPANKTGYLTSWQGSSGTATGTYFTRIMLRATQHLGILLPGVFIIQAEVGTLNSGNVLLFDPPLVFPATTDVKLAAISDAGAANALVSGAIFGWIE